MRADQKDSLNVVRRECDHHSENAGKACHANLREKTIARQPVIQGCATLCAQGEKELIIRAPLLLMQPRNLLCGSFRYQRASRHGHRLPALTPRFAFLIES